MKLYFLYYFGIFFYFFYGAPSCNCTLFVIFYYVRLKNNVAQLSFNQLTFCSWYQIVKLKLVNKLTI